VSTTGRPSAEPLHDLERPRIEPIGEWVVDEPERHLDECRLVRIRRPEPLEGAEVVGVRELLAQLLEDLPMVPLELVTEVRGEVRAKVLDDTVVVEQRFVHAAEEHSSAGFGHARRRA
jgi:hypothetical protein